MMNPKVSLINQMWLTCLAFRGVIFLCATILLLPGARGQELAQWASGGRGIVISPNGYRAAQVVLQGSRFGVAVNGEVMGGAYDEIIRLIGADIFRAGGTRFVYFSPDSRRVAFIGRRGSDVFLVENGIEGPAWESITNVLFSPDSSLLLYFAEDASGRERIVINGQSGTSYDFIENESLQVNRSGAYLYEVDRPFGTAVVFNGVEGPTYSSVDGLVLAEQGHHYIYIARASSQAFAVIDGVEGPRIPNGLFQQLKLSPNGERHFYEYSSTATGNEAVIDGTVVRGKFIIDFEFSPDSSRYAYTWFENRPGIGQTDYIVNVDGVDGFRYSGLGNIYFVDDSFRPIGSTPIMFTPDSQKLIYFGEQGGLSFLVVNGQESGGFSDVGDMIFSADGSRYAFSARTAGASGFDFNVVVADEVAGPVYEEIVESSVGFTPDSSKVVYLTESPPFSDRSMQLIVDGTVLRFFPEGVDRENRVGFAGWHPSATLPKWFSYSRDSRKVVFAEFEDKGFFPKDVLATTVDLDTGTATQRVMEGSNFLNFQPNEDASEVAYATFGSRSQELSAQVIVDGSVELDVSHLLEDRATTQTNTTSRMTEIFLYRPPMWRRDSLDRLEALVVENDVLRWKRQPFSVNPPPVPEPDPSPTPVPTPTPTPSLTPEASPTPPAGRGLVPVVEAPGTRPVVSVKGGKRIKTRKSRVRIRGIARDNGTVAYVEYKAPKSKFQRASGGTRWVLRARLKKSGRNVIKIRAFDGAGQRSKTQKVVVQRQ